MFLRIIQSKRTPNFLWVIIPKAFNINYHFTILQCTSLLISYMIVEEKINTFSVFRERCPRLFFFDARFFGSLVIKKTINFMKLIHKLKHMVPSFERNLKIFSSLIWISWQFFSLYFKFEIWSGKTSHRTMNSVNNFSN